MVDRTLQRSGERSELIYVSWGGTGRAAALREAMNTASDADSGLVYLAILDDSTFGDIDNTMLGLAKSELAWLLDAQIELTKRQTGIDDVPVRVLVRSGDVAQQVIEAASAVGKAQVLLGGPFPESAADAVTDLIKLLADRVDGTVSAIEP